MFEGKRFGPGDRTLRRPAAWRHLWNPFRPSWGEPYKEIVARMMAAVDDARDAARGHEAVIVSHQLPIWTTRLHAETAVVPPRPAQAAVHALLADLAPLRGRHARPGHLLRAGRRPDPHRATRRRRSRPAAPPRSSGPERSRRPPPAARWPCSARRSPAARPWRAPATRASSPATGRVTQVAAERPGRPGRRSTGRGPRRRAARRSRTSAASRWWSSSGASWCAPCRAEAPTSSRPPKELGDGAQFVGHQHPRRRRPSRRRASCGPSTCPTRRSTRPTARRCSPSPGP